MIRKKKRGRIKRLLIRATARIMGRKRKPGR